MNDSPTPEELSRARVAESVPLIEVPPTIGATPPEEPAPLIASNPVIVNLGDQSSKSIKNLAKGKGKLLRRLVESLEQLKSHGTISATAQPIIVIVKEPKKFSLFG